MNKQNVFPTNVVQHVAWKARFPSASWSHVFQLTLRPPPSSLIGSVSSCSASLSTVLARVVDGNGIPHLQTVGELGDSYIVWN